jgi:signal peptidase I
VLIAVAGTAWSFFAPPGIGGSTEYVVTHGVSMEPHFHSGDLAIVRPAGQYRVGEIVAYHSTLLHEVVLHRIVAIHNGRYTFKGDNNHFLDPVHPTRADLIGVLWIHVPHGGALLSYVHQPVVVAAILGLLGLVLLSGTGEVARRGQRRRRRPAAHGPAAPGGSAMASREQAVAGSANLRAALIASGIASLLFLVLAVAGFTASSERPALRKLPFSQRVDFGYHATAAAGPVYPSGVVVTGDPVFLQLVHRLAIRADYTLTSTSTAVVRGTQQLTLQLSGPAGWTRTLPLTSVKRFSGSSVRAGGTLDLASLQAMFNTIERQTGVPSDSYIISVVDDVHVHGTIGGRPMTSSATPALAFQLGALQLTATGASSSGGGVSGAGGQTSGERSTSFQAVTPGGVTIDSTAPNTIGFLGVRVNVSTLRLLAPVGLLIGLACTVLLTILVLRGRAFGEATRIQGQYGHMIVPINAGGDLGWPAIDVPSIKALVRLAEVSGQLILHSHDELTDTYMVNDEGSVYRYQVKLPKVVWGEWTEPTVAAAAPTDPPAAAQSPVPVVPAPVFPAAAAEAVGSPVTAGPAAG